MRTKRSKEFDEGYLELPENIQNKIEKAMKLLELNPQHPSLRLKKLKGFENIWYAKVDKHHRLTFEKQGDLLIMRRVGSHNDIIKKP